MPATRNSLRVIQPAWRLTVPNIGRAQHAFVWCIVGTLSHTFAEYVGFAASSTDSFTETHLLVRAFALTPCIVGVILAFSVPPTRTQGRDAYSMALRGAMLVFLLGTSVGCFRGNDLRYLVADAFRFSVPWLVVAAVLRITSVLAAASLSRTKTLFVRTLTILSVVDASATLYLRLTLPRWMRISTVMHLGLLPIGLDRSLITPAYSTCLSAAGIAAAAAAGKRGNVLALIVAMCVLLCLYNTRILRKVLLLAFVLLVSVIVLRLFLPNQYDEVRLAFDQVVSTGSRLWQDGGDQSTAGRLAEAQNIFSFFAQNPSLVLAGGGFGAEVPMLENSGVYSRNGAMHQSHTLWLTYFLRNGFIGVSVLALLFGSALVDTYRAARTGHDTSAIVVSFLVILFVVLSLKSQVFLESPLFALCISAQRAWCMAPVPRRHTATFPNESMGALHCAG